MAARLQTFIDRLRNARLALVQLDGELAEELGAGYPNSERFQQLQDNNAEAPNDEEVRLMTRFFELVDEGNRAIQEWEQHNSH